MPEFIAVTTRDYETFTKAHFDARLEDEQTRVRALYAARRFRSIWGRRDGRGVVVLMEADNAEEAWRTWESLPFVQERMIDVALYELAPYSGFC